MAQEQKRIRVVIMRGGTSKGLYLREKDLPRDQALRDLLILALFGSPDPRQIDGLGGADSLTSKLAIVSPSQRPDADVDYTFGQVSITTPLVDYNTSCGNIIAGVGPYAIDEGLVKATEPVTRIRIYHTNIKSVVVAEVPVNKGKARVSGDCMIDGVPGSGAPILIDFGDCAGGITGSLLPTGRTRDIFEMSGRTLPVSIVDAANPVVFIRASDLGLVGTELPQAINSRPDLLKLLEEIRSLVAERVGLVPHRSQATARSPANPKVAFVSPAASYQSIAGDRIEASQVNLVARIMSMQKPHQAYAVTGALCTAVAAQMPGTLVNEVFRPGEKRGRVCIGHPAGTITVEVSLEPEGAGYRITRAAVERTARRLMEGWAYMPREKLRA